MVKQLLSKDIKEYLKTGPNKVLLDVRTKEELDTVGKPDGDTIGLKTYFLEIERNNLFNFVEKFKHLNISQDKEVLVICRSGERSQISAELLHKEDCKTLNISDGFEGSAEGTGWINCGLPIKF